MWRRTCPRGFPGLALETPPRACHESWDVVSIALSYQRVSPSAMEARPANRSPESVLVHTFYMHAMNRNHAGFGETGR